MKLCLLRPVEEAGTEEKKGTKDGDDRFPEKMVDDVAAQTAKTDRQPGREKK